VSYAPCHIRRVFHAVRSRLAVEKFFYFDNNVRAVERWCTSVEALRQMSVQSDNVCYQSGSCFSLAVPDHGLQSVEFRLFPSLSLGLVPDALKLCGTLRPVGSIMAFCHLLDYRVV